MIFIDTQILSIKFSTYTKNNECGKLKGINYKLLLNIQKVDDRIWVTLGEWLAFYSYHYFLISVK